MNTLLGVVAVDSSGSFEKLPIKVVAAKKVTVQKHYCYYFDAEDIEKYKKYIHKKWLLNKQRKRNQKKVKPENYRERISSVLYFQTMHKLVKHTDEIQIDYDFEGWRQEIVKSYLKRLFVKVYAGTSISNPSIDFITDHCEKGGILRKHMVKLKKQSIKNLEKCNTVRRLKNYWIILNKFSSVQSPVSPLILHGN